MIIVFMIIGASIGAIANGLTGTALGAGFGYILGSILDTRKRLDRLEQEILQVRSQDRGTAQTLVSEPQAQFGHETEACEAEESPAETEETVERKGDSTSKEAGKEPYAGTHEGLFPSVAPLRERLERLFSSSNLLVKVGVVIVFFGVSFLLKYAAEHKLMPIELRLAAAAAAGMGLLATGWRLRIRREGYALALQGGGIGILYITIFAALRLYNLIPATAALAMLVAIGALSAVLAIFQDAASLALLGASGGFLAPVLASTGQGSHVMLFSYYAILNAGVLAIAWFKAWRMLNLVGFVFTFGLGSLWGFRYYGPNYFATTESFLILFFLLYVAVAVLFALRQSPKLRGYVDATIVFGTPLLSFGLQSFLVKSTKYGVAWSALGLALFYAGLSLVLFLKKTAGMKTLAEAFLAIGVVFGTFTIPLTLDNRWTGALWALEGAAMVWIGIRQLRPASRIFGLALQILSGLVFMEDMGRLAERLPVLNGFYFGCLVTCFAGLFSAYYIHLNHLTIRPWERTAGIIMAVWGLLWWFGSGLGEIESHIGLDYQSGFAIAFVALSCLACNYLEKSLKWPLLSYPALGLLPALFLMALELWQENLHPFTQTGFAAWPIAFAVYYRILYRNETLRKDLLAALHAGAFWLLCWIASWELGWQLNHWVAPTHTWSIVGWGLAPPALVLAASSLERKLSWPLDKHRAAYIGFVLGVVAIYTWCWILYVNLTEAGDPQPLSYAPLLNPLDLTIGFAFVSLLVWFFKLRAVQLDVVSLMPPRIVQGSIRYFPGFYALSIFVSLNAVLVRTIHFWAGIAFGWRPMIGSVIFETSISIFWSLLALFAMIFSTRRSFRRLWLTGAVLLGVVVVKLFLIDLSNTGTVARIVSFIGVGILLLVVGYFSPFPPKKETRAQ